MVINLKDDGYTYDDLVKCFNKVKSTIEEGSTYEEITKETYHHVMVKDTVKNLNSLLKNINELGEDGYKAEGGLTNYYNGHDDMYVQLMVKKVVEVEKIEVSSWSRLSKFEVEVYNLNSFVHDGWVEKGYVDDEDELVFMDDDNNLLTKKGLFEVEDDYEEDWGFDD